MNIKDKLGAITWALGWVIFIVGVCLILNDRHNMEQNIRQLQTQLYTIKDTEESLYRTTTDTTQRQTVGADDKSKFRTTETIDIHIDRHYHYNNDTKNNYENYEKTDTKNNSQR